MKRAILISLLSANLLSQAPAQDKPVAGIRFSGYVRTDVIYDTRQSSASNGLREGHFYLFPDNVLYDAGHADVNATPSFHILSIQTRLRGDISGPDAFGAKTSGMFEAEFFGTGETDLNGFRLRHAFTRLDWPKVAIQVGQAWHPMFPADCFPQTISFNTGAPFTPFSRNPQVRLIYKPGKVSATLSAYSQRDFTSTGPDGSSNKYMRNSGLPGIDAQIKVPFSGSAFLVAGADYKILRPELRTSRNYENTNTLGSLSGFATLSIKTKPVSLAMMGSYVQNATDIIMIGGYGATPVTDTITGIRDFANLTTASGWIDLYTNGKQFQAGIFAGYSRNLGSGTEMVGPLYGRGTNIAYLARISPRLMAIRGQLNIALEFETTIAGYGQPDPYGNVLDVEPVVNYRILLAATYRF
jgi:hypothetical protein